MCLLYLVVNFIQDAKHATEQCLEEYDQLLKKVDEKRRGELVRSMGLKMEQVKAELGRIYDSLRNDEELPSNSGK